MNTTNIRRPALLVEIAKRVALAFAESKDYLPKTEEEAKTWEPHDWVIAAMGEAVKECFPEMESELDRLRGLASTVYAGLGAECSLPENWLDALNAAASGEDFSTDGLLPFFADKKTDPSQEKLKGMVHLSRDTMRQAVESLSIAARTWKDGADQAGQDMLDSALGMVGMADFALSAAIDKMDPDVAKQWYIHKTTGGRYTIVEAATLQTDMPLPDMSQVMVYRGEDGRHWARPLAEFDSRFTKGDING